MWPAPPLKSAVQGAWGLRRPCSNPTGAVSKSVRVDRVLESPGALCSRAAERRATGTIPRQVDGANCMPRIARVVALSSVSTAAVFGAAGRHLGSRRLVGCQPCNVARRPPTPRTLDIVCLILPWPYIGGVPVPAENMPWRTVAELKLVCEHGLRGAAVRITP